MLEFFQLQRRLSSSEPRTRVRRGTARRGTTRSCTCLFREPVELQGEVERVGLAVVDGVPPGTAAPLPARRRPSFLLDAHVAVGTAVCGERHELAHGERVERQLRQTSIPLGAVAKPSALQGASRNRLQAVLLPSLRSALPPNPSDNRDVKG